MTKNEMQNRAVWVIIVITLLVFAGIGCIIGAAVASNREPEQVIVLVTPEPTIEPIAVAEPTIEPTATATLEPVILPEPTIEPVVEPTIVPVVELTAEQTAEPTIEPTATATPEPVILPEPTIEPVVEPTIEPVIVTTTTELTDLDKIRELKLTVPEGTVGNAAGKVYMTLQASVCQTCGGFLQNVGSETVDELIGQITDSSVLDRVMGQVHSFLQLHGAPCSCK